MPKAKRVFTAGGEVLTTEAHGDACWASEEISAVEIEVDEGVLCDICEEEIRDEPESEERIAAEPYPIDQIEDFPLK